jgi:hypothetical protein
MPRITQLDKIAQEEGTYPIKFTFKDSFRQLVDEEAITSVNWWLSDMSGSIINSRSQVSIAEITNPLYLVLFGDDLQIMDKGSGYEQRIVTLKGLYNSSFGAGLPFTYAVSFTLLNNLVIASNLNVSVVEVIFTGDTINV